VLGRERAERGLVLRDSLLAGRQLHLSEDAVGVLPLRLHRIEDPGHLAVLGFRLLDVPLERLLGFLQPTLIRGAEIAHERDPEDADLVARLASLPSELPYLVVVVRTLKLAQGFEALRHRRVEGLKHLIGEPGELIALGLTCHVHRFIQGAQIDVAVQARHHLDPAGNFQERLDVWYDPGQHRRISHGDRLTTVHQRTLVSCAEESSREPEREWAPWPVTRVVALLLRGA
jgi:hypothetical protein